MVHTDVCGWLPTINMIPAPLISVTSAATAHRRPVAASSAATVEDSWARIRRQNDVEVDWQRDDGWGHSDHREFQMAGMPGVKLGVLANACRHTACDTPDKLQRAAFRRVQRVVEAALLRP